MHPFIPYGRQNITEDDIAAVTAVLRSNFLTQGPAIAQFEDAVRAATGARFAVAVHSATAGLHLAYMVLGIAAGSRVWTSPNTFVATANAALYCGAEVDFVDIDPATLNMSVQHLREKLVAAKAAGSLPDLVVPVHFSGVSCDMEAIAALAREYGFRVVEDAAHAIGARYQGKPVGDCRYSDMAVFSFHPVKIVTTAEGGVITTNDEATYKRLLMLRTHGITREDFEQPPHGAWYYEMQALSYHYRMTDMQAALGASQMMRLSDIVARRNAIAERYAERFAGTDVVLQRVPEDCFASQHLCAVQVAHRKAVFDAMRQANIGVNVHYMPVYLQPYYQRLGFKAGLCPNAEAYYARAISIPLYPQMTDADVDYVADTLLHACAEAHQSCAA